jgi:hypothetical protein
MYLDGMARNAHWYHRYEMRLRARAGARGVQVLPQELASVAPVPGKVFSFNPEAGGKYKLPDYVVDAAGGAAAPNAAYVRWTEEQDKNESRGEPVPLVRCMFVLLL